MTQTQNSGHSALIREDQIVMSHHLLLSFVGCLVVRETRNEGCFHMAGPASPARPGMVWPCAVPPGRMRSISEWIGQSWQAARRVATCREQLVCVGVCVCVRVFESRRGGLEGHDKSYRPLPRFPGLCQAGAAREVEHGVILIRITDIAA